MLGIHRIIFVVVVFLCYGLYASMLIISSVQPLFLQETSALETCQPCASRLPEWGAGMMRVMAGCLSSQTSQGPPPGTGHWSKPPAAWQVARDNQAPEGRSNSEPATGCSRAYDMCAICCGPW